MNKHLIHAAALLTLACGNGSDAETQGSIAAGGAPAGGSETTASPGVGGDPVGNADGTTSVGPTVPSVGPAPSDSTPVTTGGAAP